MATELLQSNTQCHSETHTEHLCYIISQGFHLSDMQKYKALVEEPQYRCDHCGRIAKADGNLCVPVPL
jgi:hypothetical protein